MNKTALLVLSVAVGSFGAGYWLNQSGGEQLGESSSAEPKPIYWVAPMDANYRRDEPGLSPMGMELVPVYAEDVAGDDSAGMVKINPVVENNLGVRVATVSQGALTQPLATVGYVGFDEDKLWHLHSRVDGWIEKLYTKYEGEYVKAGSPLLELYSPALVNAQEDFLNVLSRRNAKTIASSTERLKTLGMTNKQIKELKKSRKIKQRITFYAPQDGYVTGLNVREGMFVTPKQRVMAVGSLETVWVIAEVFERQASWLSVGSDAQMELDYLPGQNWQGRVDYIYPILDAKTRTVKVRLRFDNKEQALKPNMFARVTLNTRTIDDALSIPKSALIRTGQQQRVVLSLGDGQYRSVAVEAGRSAGDQVEIIAGLKAGEQVVTSAQFLLDSESSLSADFNRMTPRRFDAQGNVIGEEMDHSQMDHSQMDHSQMDHSQMDHSQMDHSQMDHSQMDHSQMDHSQMDHSQMEHPQAQMDHSQMDHSQMDHSQMEHPQMDHSQMDHSQMDHSKMDHSKMEHSQAQMDHSQMDHSKMNHDKKEVKP